MQIKIGWGFLVALLVILKLANVITWSWWIILFPFTAFLVLSLVIILLGLIGNLLERR